MNKGRLLHNLSVITVALSLALTISCSDSATDSTPKAIGDPNDPQFLAISEQLTDAALDFDALDWANSVWDSVPGLSPLANPNGDIVLKRGVGDSLLSYSLTIDSVTFWIVFQISVAGSGGAISVIDSLRFSGPNGPGLPSVLGNSVTSVEIHVHAQGDINDGSTFTGSVASHSILTVSLLGLADSAGGDTLSHSGTSFDTLIGTASDSDATCQFTITSSKTATNVLTIDDLQHPCPIDGSISASVTVNMSCTIANGAGGTDSLSVTGGWAVSASFNSDGSANMVFENSDTRWTGTEVCQGDVQASGLAGISIRPGGGN